MIGELPARSLQRDMHGRHGTETETEHAGLDGGDAESRKTRTRFDAPGVGITALGHDHCRRTAVQAGRIARRDRAIGTERGTQLCQRFHGRFRTRLLVARELDAALAPFYFDGDEFGIDCAALRQAIAMALRREKIAVSTAHPFAASAHVPHAIRLALGSVSLTTLEQSLQTVARVIADQTY
ncbi:hypothetical protein HDG34_002670 [Paraburkholderia sp. HC6.4b]|nr:hypothetical protein [Paraburkholderia sp. HC6.4b]MBB5450563.1 hypothetical protein [Paraburkholderia sp. Kb1A]